MTAFTFICFEVNMNYEETVAGNCLRFLLPSLFFDSSSPRKDTEKDAWLHCRGESGGSKKKKADVSMPWYVYVAGSLSLRVYVHHTGVGVGTDRDSQLLSLRVSVHLGLSSRVYVAVVPTSVFSKRSLVPVINIGANKLHSHHHYK